MRAHEDVDASYLRVRHEDVEGHEPGSLPWRSAGAAGEGHADLPSEGMGAARSGSNNDDDRRDADGAQTCVIPPHSEVDAEKDGEGQQGTQWSSRWSKLRDRPIARSSPQTPSGPTKADGGGTTDRGRRLRDGKAFVRRRKSRGGQQQPPPQSPAAGMGLVNVTTLADLEELYPPTREPEVSRVMCDRCSTLSAAGPQKWALYTATGPAVERPCIPHTAGLCRSLCVLRFSVPCYVTVRWIPRRARRRRSSSCAHVASPPPRTPLYQATADGGP